MSETKQVSQWTSKPPMEAGCYLYCNVKSGNVAVLNLEEDDMGKLRCRMKELNWLNRGDWMTLFQFVLEEGRSNMMWQKITLPEIEILCDRCGKPANMFGKDGHGGVCEECEATLCEACAQWDEDGICQTCHDTLQESNSTMRWTSNAPTKDGCYRVNWFEMQLRIFTVNGVLMVDIYGSPYPLNDWLRSEMERREMIGDKRPLYWCKVELPPLPEDARYTE